MILDFRNRATEDLFNGIYSKSTRTLPRGIWSIALRKLDMLNAAHDLQDLRVPPGNRLKMLKEKMAGYYSMRINDQYRVVFQWKDGNARDVYITDYHT